jgi:hypothetical protein
MLLLSGGLFYQTLQFPEPSVASGEVVMDDLLEIRKQRLAQFYREGASPLLATAHAKNVAAEERARAAMDALFKKYEAGSPKFASALTGWGTRFKILYRSGVESVEGKDEKTWTQQVVQEKFDATIVSQTQLEADLTAITKQFAYELEANRNELLVGLETQLTAAELTAELAVMDHGPFRQQFDVKLQAMLAKMPSNSVKIGVGSLAAGIAAEEAVRQVVRVVVAQLATRLAATAVTAGGTAGAAAATGAGGGTVVAPGVGTAIGLVGGFLVGAVVDWKMTDKFEDKVEAQVNEFLLAMKTQLMTDPNGMLPMLQKQAADAELLHKRALEEILVLP